MSSNQAFFQSLCFSDAPHEECGVFGVYNRDGADLDTARLTYYGLFALQHRGQESCGIAINNDNHITCYKDMGLVSEVFRPDILDIMTGHAAIGHVRYSTTGGCTRENAQPLTAKYVKGTLTIAHNGNICNAAQLRTQLQLSGALFQTTSDTEVIAFLIARERLTSKSVEEAVAKVVPQLRGSFSLLVMSPKKLIAVRDPYGFRPLCMGKLQNSTIFSSESCALDSIGAQWLRDIRPGEMVVAGEESDQSMTLSDSSHPSALCIFEHIYFARPDSVIDGQSVYTSRMQAGHILAQRHPVEADLVIGVPDSGLIAAMGYAQASGIPYGEGLIKNRYVGRSFIQPTQAMRENCVRVKLNALRQNVQGKRIVMVDDSIVRGTTIARIVGQLKEAGAAQIHVRISAPHFLHPCYFGTDITSGTPLISREYDDEQLCRHIGAHSIGFLPVEDLPRLIPQSSVGFCSGCFSGYYPCPVPTTADKTVFE